MTNTYKVSGITCTGCENKVKHLISKVPGVKNIEVNFKTQLAQIETELPISIQELKSAMSSHPNYQINEIGGKEAGFWEDIFIWKKASRNTLNCLIGCSIGDFAMIIYLQSYHQHINMFLMMTLAMAAGLFTSVLLETILLKLNEKFDWTNALKTAVGMSFLSMLAMELAENTTDYFLTGGQIPTSDPYYWLALAISMMAGFIVPLPYNYFKLKKFGKACH